MITYYILYVFLNPGSTWTKYNSLESCRKQLKIEQAKNKTARMKCLKGETK